MPIAFVRSTGRISGNNVDSVGGNFGALPAAGNAITVETSAWNGSNADMPAGSVTDNQSNTYSRAVQSPLQSGGVCSIFYDESIGSPSGTHTVTVDPTGTGNYLEFSAQEWSSFASSALDKTNGNNAASDSPTSGSTGTLSQADELVIGVVGTYNGHSDVGIDPPSGYTNLSLFQNEGSTVGHSADYMIVSATTAQNISWGTVFDNLVPWGACVATFKAAGGGGGGDTLMGQACL